MQVSLGSKLPHSSKTPPPRTSNKLRDIIIQITLPIHSLQILLLQQYIHTLLNIPHFRSKPRSYLNNHHLDQLDMFELSSRLHDTNDGGLDQEAAVFFNRAVRFVQIGFFTGFEGDFEVHPDFLGTERWVENEVGGGVK